jgi:hypothetical protein
MCKVLIMTRHSQFLSFPKIMVTLLSLILAFSVVAWTLHWRHIDNRETGTITHDAKESSSDPSVVAFGLGYSPDAVQSSAPPESNRFQLVGLLAGAGHGAALISIDSGSPEPYNLGRSITERWFLSEVLPTSVKLSCHQCDNASVIILDLQLLKPASFFQ